MFCVCGIRNKTWAAKKKRLSFFSNTNFDFFSVKQVHILETTTFNSLFFTGKYLYIEASSPRRPGDAASLVSPLLSQQPHCLKIWYHMYGKAVGQLNVRISFFLYIFPWFFCSFLLCSSLPFCSRSNAFHRWWWFWCFFFVNIILLQYTLTCWNNFLLKNMFK